jgi:hypothetical protein
MSVVAVPPATVCMSKVHLHFTLDLLKATARVVLYAIQSTFRNELFTGAIGIAIEATLSRALVAMLLTLVCVGMI